MQQYLRGREIDNWISQKKIWQEKGVTFDKFEDLINIVKKKFLNDFKSIEMCWQYFALIYQGCEHDSSTSSLQNEMTMCKNQCNVHVKIHFHNPEEKTMGLRSMSKFDGGSCQQVVQLYLPRITTEIEKKYPTEDIFLFLPVAVLSKFHTSGDELESYDDNTSYPQDVKEKADEIWSELTKQHYIFFKDFIHSCEYGCIPLLRNTCPVFVRRKNPFIVH